MPGGRWGWIRVFAAAGVAALFALPLAVPIAASPSGAVTPAQSLHPHDCFEEYSYYLVGADGGVFAFCDAHYYGSLANTALNAPIVGMATNFYASNDPTHGYYLVGADGGVFAFGNEPFFGSLGNTALRAPVVGLVPTPCVAQVDPQCTYNVFTIGGYYLVGADGGVFTFGNAPFFGSLSGHHLNAPIVALVPYSDSHCSGTACTGADTGYYLVGADGGVFTFGDAPFVGSLASLHLSAPIVSATGDGDLAGLTLVGADGGTFNLGGAPFIGSLAGTPLSAPIVDVLGQGPDLVAADGGVFTLGSNGASFAGSMAGSRLRAPIVGGADVTYFPGPS